MSESSVCRVYKSGGLTTVRIVRGRTGGDLFAELDGLALVLEDREFVIEAAEADASPEIADAIQRLRRRLAADGRRIEFRASAEESGAAPVAARSPVDRPEAVRIPVPASTGGRRRGRRTRRRPITGV